MTVAGQPVALKVELGSHIKDAGKEGEAKKAQARYLLDTEKHKTKTISVTDLANKFLDWSKRNNRPGTYSIRREAVFDFVTGLPPRFVGATEKPPPAEQIHSGYGDIDATEISPADIDEWLAAHNWNGGARTKIQSVKRMFNFGVERQHLNANPIRGYDAGKVRERITYFTSEVEDRLCEHASPALALAIKICIRTGARYGVEYCALISRHVGEAKRGMTWHFPDGTKVDGKPRTILIPKDIAEITREHMRRVQPGEPIFRNNVGTPWEPTSLRRAFGRLKDKLEGLGNPLDEDDCMYTTRHTFAKRILGGYWNGKPATIEQVAALMGNTRDVCWRHYAKWCEKYTDPLWDALE